MGVFNVKILIPILGVMGVNIFFSASSIIGYQYKGAEDSKVYIVFMVLVALLNLFLFFKQLLLHSFRITYRELIVILLPLIIFSFFLIRGGINSGFSPLSTTYFSYFLIWIVPALYAAIYIYKANLYGQLGKYMEIVMVLFTFSVMFTTLLPFVQGVHFTTLGGATYQTASYIAAFAYGLNLYFLINGNRHERFKFTKLRIYKWISILFLFIQLFGIFFSGGRGGIVLFTIYTLYFLVTIIIRKEKKTVFKTLLGLISFVVIILAILPKLLEDPRFNWAFNRVFQFISFDSGVNWEGSSGRDVVYSNAIDLIIQKPLFGYGLFGFWDISGYPHNLFLEILLNGGIVYLVFFIFVIVILLIKLLKMIKYKPDNKLLMVLLLYPLTMLMFSGTYMVNAQMWFILAFIFICNVKVEKFHIKKNY